MAKSSDDRKRPFWQTEPCPSWCCGWHLDSEHPDDRMHASDWEAAVPLTLEEPHVGFTVREGKNVEYVDPAELKVYVVQGIRESAPRVQLHTFIVDHAGLEIDMTVDEARKVVRRLSKAIRLAESA